MRDKYAMVRALGLSVLYLVLASPAFAHPGHVGSGFLHPLTGPDHVLAMIGAGMWAAFLAARKPSAALLVPLAFMVMMAFGAAAGFAGIKLPFSEAGVIASVFMLGGLVVAAVRVPTATAMLVVGWFAMLHGYSHAVEAPASDPGRYILGFLTATALLQLVGLGLGRVVQKFTGNLGLRALGGLVMAGGALVLAAH
ncbi:MAG: HupE/UreJ family protein [Proteobacteria bacterium]|nr:HupE/UreJ family protein [Pseudomonadota bacterium]